MRVHSWFLVCLRFAAISVASVLLAEIALRLVHPYVPVPTVRTGTYNDFRSKPFAKSWDGFVLNSKGFKDVEYEDEKPPGSYRILGIGDSFAYGAVPYKANFLTLLEEKFQASYGQVEVINMEYPIWTSPTTTPCSATRGRPLTRIWSSFACTLAMTSAPVVAGNTRRARIC